MLCRSPSFCPVEKCNSQSQSHVITFRQHSYIELHTAEVTTAVYALLLHVQHLAVFADNTSIVHVIRLYISPSIAHHS
jgi:hypothetical protein